MKSIPKKNNVLIEKQYKIKKMGTSGLRQTQEIYNQPMFLEQFTQGVVSYFKELTDTRTVAKNNKTILLGGDPRKGNNDRINKIAEIFTGNGFKIIIADNGLASTPAMSHAIRHLETAGGVILTASHNPFTDVGIKINSADGSPALEDAVTRIHQLQNSVSGFCLINYDIAVQSGLIEYTDIIGMYADLMDKIFDLNSMKRQISERKIKGVFDSMHGAAGPFAREIFLNRLEMDAKILRQEPRQDLGGYNENNEPLHPEPDFDFIPKLIELNSTGEYDIVSAWDSDVDRRLDGGSGFFIESADEFALFARYSDLINLNSLFSEQVYFCRSTVTADTIGPMQDYLKKKFTDKQVQTVETPTGFKWIAELGNWGVEESNGVGNPYLREKDGIFSTLFLLKIILHTRKPPLELMEEVWKEYGRVYFTRGEVSDSDISGKDLLTGIFKNMGTSTGHKYGDLILKSANTWDYIHPKTGEVADKNSAWVLNFSDGNTVKARFSGTGSGGYTLRVYCSKYDKKYDIPKSDITRPMKEAFNEFLKANNFKGIAKKYTDANQPDIYKQ